MFKKNMKRLIALIVTTLTITGMLSSLGTSVSMAASKTANNVSNGDKIKIGDTTYTVVDKNYNKSSKSNSGVLLLSDPTDCEMKFNSKTSEGDPIPYNAWANSNIKIYLNSTDTSQQYLVKNKELKYLRDHNYLLSSSDSDTDNVFLLSYAEWNSILSNNKKNSSVKECLGMSKDVQWWLRTPAKDNTTECYCVSKDGNIATLNNVSQSAGIRPVLNLAKSTPLKSTGNDQWSLNLKQYTVSFVINDLRDSRIKLDDQHVFPGEKAVKPDVADVPGKVFAGFYKDAGFSEKFDFDTPIKNDTVIYALYKDYQKVGIQEITTYPGNIGLTDILHTADIKFKASDYQSTGITDNGITTKDIPLPGNNGIYTIDLTNPDVSTFDITSNSGTTHTATAYVTLDDIFDTVKFPCAGLYTYEFQQVNTGQADWIYNIDNADKIYTAIVNVVNAGDADEFKANQVYVKVTDSSFASFNDANTADKVEKVEFKNIYIPTKTDSTITVSKKVTGTATDKAKQFEYKLSLIFPEYIDSSAKTAVVMTLNGAGESEQLDSENYKFTLAAGESFVLKNIPVGTVYSVIETPVTGYTTYVTDTTVKSNSEASCGGLSIGRSADNYQIVGQVNVTEPNKVIFHDSIKDVTPTGILLSSTPYMLIAIAVMGIVAALVVNKKKKRVV